MENFVHFNEQIITRMLFMRMNDANISHHRGEVLYEC
jgi:hypothetical protein